MKVKNEKTGKIEDVRLPKRFKDKWVKALRSGKYTQTMGYLQIADSYSALGVACRIQHPYVKMQNKSYIADGGSGFQRARDINVPKILKGTSITNDVVYQLNNLELKGKSFNQVAAWIDKNL